ncbi:MAG: hypothetical protein JST11_25750 [Acidobacteria bacterium]|nr:hypothetical protein [Acidobacteriota bacterium]
MSVYRWMFLCVAVSGGYGQELPLVCSPAKPVAASGEAVQLTAWAPAEGFVYRWSTNDGRIEGEGRQVLWRLGESKPGEPKSGTKTATVEATREGQAPLSCKIEVFVQQQFEVRRGSPRRYLLERWTPEEKGYGLYSYLLLTQGDGEMQERNRKIIEAYVSRIVAGWELRSSLLLQNLNAIFVPVDAEPPNEDATAEWIFKHYDYRNARQLLDRLPGPPLRGPYLVSTKEPLSQYTGGPLLNLDVSRVPARVVPFWMDEFIAQGEQERWDQPRSLSMFELKLRTLISIAADGVPVTQNAMTAVLTFLK